MGTSKSSAGAPSGVPLVPPWVPQHSDTSPLTQIDIAEKPNEQSKPPNLNELPSLNPKLNTSSPIAQHGRFGAARSQFGQFARGGESTHMKRGLGQYTKKGLGGKKNASKRLVGTAKTAGALYSALDALSGQSTTNITFDLKLLEKKSADEVISAVVDATRPVDGTQDTEASRASINEALVELLEKQPEADLFELTDDQKDIVIEGYIANDIFRRFSLDVSGAIRKKASDAITAGLRLNEIREYIKQVVAESFRKVKSSNKKVGQMNMGNVIKDVLDETFGVFEGYIK